MDVNSVTETDVCNISLYFYFSNMAEQWHDSVVF